MIRLVASRPASYNLEQLRLEAAAVAPGCRAVNEVAPDQLAAYWDDTDAPAQGTWMDVVAAHIPEQQQLELNLPPEAVAAQAIADEIDARLAPGSVNSISEVKAAIRDGLAAAVTRLSG